MTGAAEIKYIAKNKFKYSAFLAKINMKYQK